MRKRKSLVDKRLKELDVDVDEAQARATEYAYRYELKFDGDLRRLAEYIEDVEGVEILSLGHALELVKDLGDATHVAEQYKLGKFTGTHAIGHTRMATESDVDIRSAHPYWAYPFSDVSVVHNGQLTNYWTKRREMERRGHRFSVRLRFRADRRLRRRRDQRGRRSGIRDETLRSTSSTACSRISSPRRTSSAWPRT